MKLSSTILVFVSLAFLSTSAQGPQQTQSSAPKNDAPTQSGLTISKQTQLVLVPVVVTDRSGHHLGGLTKDAFRIEQDGKPQTVGVFEEVKNTGRISKLASEEPGVVANFAPADPNSRRVLVVVLDLLNTPFLSQGRTKAALIEFLGTELPQDEQISLFSLGANGLHQLHSFTTDTKTLITALRKVSGQLGTDDMLTSGDSDSQVNANPGADDPNASREASSIMQQLQADSEALYGAYKQRESTRVTLAALEQLAGAFTGVPGRKAVLWATGGFPFTIDDPHAFARMGTDMVESYERTWRALNDANLAVYPIDVNGLMAQDPKAVFDAATARPRANVRGGIMQPRVIPYDRHREQMDTMLAFANATGGKAFVNRNDLENGFRAAEQDSDSYYMLAYYPQVDEKPGWHKLKVKVNVPGAQVRAREGFYAGSASQTSDEAVKKEIFTALASPADYTGIHFGVRLTGIATQRMERVDSASGAVVPKESKSISYRLLIPTSSLVVDAAQGNAIDLDVVVFALSKDARLVSQTERRISARLTPEALAKTGISLPQIIEVEPQAIGLRFLIRDNQSGKIGTVRTPAELR